MKLNRKSNDRIQTPFQRTRYTRQDLLWKRGREAVLEQAFEVVDARDQYEGFWPDDGVRGVEAQLAEDMAEYGCAARVADADPALNVVFALEFLNGLDDVVHVLRVSNVAVGVVAAGVGRVIWVG